MQSRSHSGITGKARETLAKILDHILKDECVLSATTRDYRWTVSGPNLYSLNRLFDEQRRQLDYWLDKVLERTKSVGVAMRDTEFNANVARAAVPQTKEPGARLPAHTMIRDLLGRHEELAHRLRADIARLGDPVTAELLTRLVEFHETSAWMLRMIYSGPEAEQPA